MMEFGKGNQSLAAMAHVRCAGNEASIMLCHSEYVRATSDDKVHLMCDTDVGIQCSSEEGGFNCIAT